MFPAELLPSGRSSHCAESHPDVLNNSAATPSCSHPFAPSTHQTAIASHSHPITQPSLPTAILPCSHPRPAGNPLHHHPTAQPSHPTATPSHSRWLSLQHHLRSNKAVHRSSHCHRGWLHPSTVQGDCLKGSARTGASGATAEANSSPSSTSYITSKPCISPPPPPETQLGSLCTARWCL